MKEYECITVCMSLCDSDKHLLSYLVMLASLGIGHKYQFLHIQEAEGKDPSPGRKDSLEIMRKSVETAFARPIDDDRMGFDVREGVRVDEILHYLELNHCGLVLMGHREKRTGKRSLARRIAMLSPCTVWMVPDTSPIRLDKILATIDFSNHSVDTVTVAGEVAHHAGLKELDVLHVYFDTSTIRYEEHIHEVQGNEEKAFAQFLERCTRRRDEKRQIPFETLGLKLNPLYEEASNVTRGILWVAEREGSDLIVMNTRGRSAAASILLGSDTSQTLMESHVPVLTVKHRGASISWFEALTNPKKWTDTDLKAN